VFITDPESMAVSFTVLGPVTAVRAGVPVPLSGRRVLALLAALLLSPNKDVPTDRLIEWAWGEARSAHPRAALQNAMSRLRHAVGDDVVETTPLGYRLRGDANTLDLLAFEELAAAAAAADRAGDTALAADRLRQAIGLWRLPLLSNVDAPELSRHAATLLTERYLAAHEEHARLCLLLGRHADVVAQLRDLVVSYPFREPLAAHLMTALAGAGRRADALVTYEAVSRTLREELGVQPGAVLRSLHTSILRAESQGGDDAAGPGGGPAPGSQLPARSGVLHGRAREARVLDRWLAGPDRAAVTAVVGPAGVGKSALAVDAAHRRRTAFPDGTLYLDLDGYAAGAPLEPVAALGQLLDTFGAAAVPDGLAARAARWRGLLADRRLLLVLDNARDSGQVRPLLPGAASAATVLVTSRHQLRGLVARDGARRLALDGLGVDAVRALLGELTGRPAEGFARDRVAELVDRCAGLPLAVRVVAERLARTGGTLDDALEALRGPAFLDELSAGDGTDTDLRTTLSWSCRALDAETARGYHRLGRHAADTWSLLAAATALRRSPEQARLVLDGLTAVHLLRPAGAGRWTMPAPVRAQAGEGCPSHPRPDGAPEPAVGRGSRGAAAAVERADSAMGARLARFAVVGSARAAGEVHDPR
jgi:DNA-binding SARP family transcriptional activator